MLQDRIKAPQWLCSVILCQKHLPSLTKKRITQEIGEPFLWTDSRVELVKLLQNEKNFDRRTLIVGKDQQALLRFAKILSKDTAATKVVVLNEDKSKCLKFDKSTHQT